MKKLIAIVGPTATGKTALSVDIAKIFNGEVISADSMLVYKYMNIGTAKPSPEEMAGVPHHMIDLVTPDVTYTVYDYQLEVFRRIELIAEKGVTPVLVGGTGLYVQSVLDGYKFGSAKKDDSFRRDILAVAQKLPINTLHKALQKVDPISAEKIHPHDLRRVVRALEFYRSTGQPISNQKKIPSHLHEMGFTTVRIGLTMSRELLYQRIEARVDHMIEKGLVEEVAQLHKNGYNMTHYAMQGLGYKQISLYLSGEMSIDEAIEQIKKETRRFAKRQFTWFQRDKKIHWMHVDQFENQEELTRNVCDLIKDILTLR
jgi:tRNA dimethylallyltransferase